MISTKTFQNLQPGVSAADDLRVRTPINQALQWLGEGLPNELNAEFAQISQSVSVQIAAYAASRPTFHVHKNGTAQTSISSSTNVLVTWSTEDWDIGSHFVSNAWTPPAGKHRISCQLLYAPDSAVDNELLYIILRKDGIAHRRYFIGRPGTGNCVLNASFLVDSDGTNAFDIVARKDGAGTGVVSGVATDTWFSGEAIS